MGKVKETGATIRSLLFLRNRCNNNNSWSEQERQRYKKGVWNQCDTYKSIKSRPSKAPGAMYLRPLFCIYLFQTRKQTFLGKICTSVKTLWEFFNKFCTHNFFSVLSLENEFFSILVIELWFKCLQLSMV